MRGAVPAKSTDDRTESLVSRNGRPARGIGRSSARIWEKSGRKRNATCTLLSSGSILAAFERNICSPILFPLLKRKTKSRLKGEPGSFRFQEGGSREGASNNKKGEGGGEEE